jgi:hypothetical protein
MATRTVLALIAVAQLTVWPALAEPIDKDNAHHYQGGAKTDVPHLMQHIPSSPNASVAADTINGHHYSGGPKTEVPHHMGKKE